MRYLILLISLFPWVLQAQVKPTDAQQIQSVSQLLNGGFENGKTTWAASGGTFLTTMTSPMVGAVHATWDSNGAAQTLCSPQMIVRDDIGSKNSVAVFLAKVPSGTATHEYYVTDGTNELAVRAITSSATALSQVLNFVSPEANGSNYLRICLRSVASDEPLIAVDEFKIVPALGFNVGSEYTRNMFVATVNTAGTAASQAPTDWLQNCSLSGTSNSVKTCNFVSGIFTVAPVCVVTAVRSNTDGANVAWVISTSSSTVVVKSGGAGSVTELNMAFRIMCHKTGADVAAQTTFTPDMLNQSLYAYKNGGTVNNATITSWTAAAGSALGRFNLTSGVFTVLKAGDYLVNASVGYTATTNEGMEIRVNGTAVRTRAATGNGGNEIQALLVGLSVGDTIVVHGVGSKTFTSSDTTTTLTIVHTTGSTPTPFVIGSEKICQGYVTNSGTPTMTRSNSNCATVASDNGTGDTTLNFTTGYFSRTPDCNVTAARSSGAGEYIKTTTAPSATVLRVQTIDGAGSNTDMDFSFRCSVVAQ